MCAHAAELLEPRLLCCMSRSFNKMIVYFQSSCKLIFVSMIYILSMHVCSFFLCVFVSPDVL